MSSEENHTPNRPWRPELESQTFARSTAGSNENPIAEPIHLASVWEMASPGEAEDALANPDGKFCYRRDGHPNERSLSTKLAKLHGAAGAAVTAQGMSATMAVAWASLQPGSTVWIGDELYGKTNKLFDVDMKRWQVNVRRFCATSEEHINELENTNVDMVVVETLTNPRVQVTDIDRVAQATHRNGGTLVVDNTFATHLICQPIHYGADIVIESLSKQVNGHSDVMLGLVCWNEDKRGGPIRDAISTLGLASSPLDCYLTTRGLHTLGVRLERACKNAHHLAEALDEHDQVLGVDYPGLSTHPQNQLAQKQLRGGSGWMLSFHTAMDRDGITKLFSDMKQQTPFAPSLGDVVTTLSHPASTSHRGLTEEERRRLGITEGTVRVSCGIEPTKELVQQFLKALTR